MNKRERVIAAFHGKEVAHVPVCMWKHVPPELWDDRTRGSIRAGCIIP